MISLSSVDFNHGSALTEQANAGDTTLKLIQTKGFAISKLVLLGKLGSEDAEIVKTHGSTAPTDTLLTLLAAIKYSHSTDTPVTLLDYDQIEISRASSKGGSYSVIATIDIAVDEQVTTHKDSTGASTDYYKIRYKNTITSSFSGYSSEIPASGLSEDTLAGMVSTVYSEFSKQSEKILEYTDIVRWLNEGYLKEAGQIIDLGIDYYVKYGTDGAGAVISFVANQRAYDLSTLTPDFVRAKRFEFTYDNVNYYPADPMDSTFDHPNAVYSQTQPKYFFEGSKIVPRPTPTAAVGGIRPKYVYMPARMVNDDDVPDLPAGYRTTPVNYALQKAFQFDQKFDVSKYYGDLWADDVKTMLSAIKNRYPELPEVLPMFGASLENGEWGDGFNVPS